MKKYSLLLMCLVVSMVAMSQKAVISFDEKTHDFGKVNEEDGKITYVFNFTNRGNSPLVVNRVQASCGCTTPTWTKEPIEPGKKGAVTVTYNPQGRPGVFTKTITVYSNAAEEQFVITIHGEVVPKQTAENSPYPINMGGLMTKLKVVQLNNIEKGKTQTRSLEVQNSTKAALKVTIENLPSYLTYSVSPETLKPGEEGKINFTFNSKKCSQWGPISEDIFVVLNGAKKYAEDYKLVVTGSVVEDFSKMTLDQKRKAPILEIPVRSLKLGIVKQGTKLITKFKINNKGQNPLEIRRVVNSNKELVVRLAKMSISGGKSSEIIVELNPKNQNDGDFKKSFTIQTNDPDNSFLILDLSGTVRK